MTRGGKLPTMPLNSSTSVRSGIWRADEWQIICFFKFLDAKGCVSFSALMMGHINRGWLSGNVSLGLLKFSFPINSEVPPIWFSRLVFFRLRCSFTITMLTTSCSHLPLSSSITGLLPDDLFSARECFILNFDKFSTAHLFLCCACYYLSDCVGLVCLERKWTHRCPYFGLFSLPAHSCCLFGEEMDVLMSKFRVFRSPCSFLCRPCICVVVSCFSLSSANKLVLQVWAAKSV